LIENYGLKEEKKQY